MTHIALTQSPNRATDARTLYDPYYLSFQTYDKLCKLIDCSVSEAMSYGLTRQMIIDLLSESK
jgi:hypothetical protein